MTFYVRSRGEVGEAINGRVNVANDRPAFACNDYSHEKQNQREMQRVTEEQKTAAFQDYLNDLLQEQGLVFVAVTEFGYVFRGT